MRKSLFILLLVVILSVALVSCDQDNSNTTFPGGVTKSYSESSKQFKEVTGLYLPDLPDLECSDYYKNYKPGQTNYNFDIVSGSALSLDTYRELKENLIKQLGNQYQEAIEPDGTQSVTWEYNGRCLFCAWDNYPQKIRIDTYLIQ